MGEKRLYVWRGVYNDYHEGIAFAWAESIVDAQRLITAEAYPDPGLLAEPLVFDQSSDATGFYKGGGS